MSKAQTAPQTESYADAHPGDLAHQYVKGEIKLSDVPTGDYDDRDVNRFRRDLKVVIDNAGVMDLEKIERAGEALKELPKPTDQEE